MFAELCHKAHGKLTSVAHCNVLFDMPRLSHAWNHGTDVWALQDMAEGQLGHRHVRRNRRPEPLDPFEGWKKVLRAEVDVAEVSAGPARLSCERTREAAFIERHASDDRDVFLATDGKQLILRVLVEHVVNDLNRVDQSRIKGA